MADNIFDAQRDRRIQNLQQQSVSNVVRSNPNLRGVLTRYEDAEVSRLKLLELQRLRNKKITAGEKALLKTLRKGRRATGGKGGKQKKEKAEKTEPPKSQTQIEVDAEEKREKLRLEKLKQRQDEEFRRDKLQIEDRQEADRLAEQRDIARQGRLETARLSGADRAQRQQQFEAKQRQQLAIEDRKVRDIQERVARDDAFRHAQLQETQRLALEQLAAQQRDNELTHQREQNRIDNQRAVDADRAITDRELIGGLQGRITQLERAQFPDFPEGGLAEGRGQVSAIEDLSAVSAADPDETPTPTPTSRQSRTRSPEPEPEPASLSTPPKPVVVRASTPPRQRRFERRSEDDPTQEGVPTPGTLREKPGKTPKRFEGGATEAEITLELASPPSSLQDTPVQAQRNLRSSTPPRGAGQSTTRSQSPQVYRPEVRTLEQVRRENPVEGE